MDGYSKLPNGDGSNSLTGTAGTLRRQVYKWIRNAATTIQVCNPVCQNQQTNTRTVVVEKYGPIEDWDVSKVTHMAGVFYGVNDLKYFQSFNADISKWNVGAVHNMKNSKCSLNFIKYKHTLQLIVFLLLTFALLLCVAFTHAKSFNGDISKWDTSSVTTMYASK